MNGFVKAEYLGPLAFKEFLGANIIPSTEDFGVTITNAGNTRATLVFTTPLESYAWIDIYLSGIDADHTPKVEIHQDVNNLDGKKAFIDHFESATLTGSSSWRFPYCGRIAAISITVNAGAGNVASAVKLTSIKVTRPPDNISIIPADSTFITPGMGVGWIYDAGSNLWTADTNLPATNLLPSFFINQALGKWAKVIVKLQEHSELTSVSFLYQANVITSNLDTAEIYYDAGSQFGGFDQNLQQFIFTTVPTKFARFSIGLSLATFNAPVSAFGGMPILPTVAPGNTIINLGTAAFQSDSSYLHVVNNLQDLSDKPTARANLGLGTFALLNVVGAVLAGIASVSATTGIFSNATIGSGSFTNPALFADGSAATPAISFTAAQTSGIFRSGTNLVITNGGTDNVQLGAGVNLRSTVPLSWSSGGPTAAADLLLVRDAANTLAIRNILFAQSFLTYQVFTDPSNYERGGFRWNSNDFAIAVENAGTGVARNLRIVLAGISLAVFQASGLVAVTDNAIDLGSSGANRFRTAYLGTSVVIGSTTTVPLQCDVNNSLVIRNSTSQCGMQIYNTFTDPSNYERLFIGFVSNAAFVTPQNSGTGLTRDLVLGTPAGTGNCNFRTNGVTRWQFNASGHLVPLLDITYDIGTASFRVRQLNAGVYSGVAQAGAPTAAVIPAGFFQVVKDTTGGTVKIYYNDGGTIKASNAFV